MILTNNAKNKNPDNPNSYSWSLLATNGKEEYFNKLKNTSIKTFDKNFILDIFIQMMKKLCLMKMEIIQI